MENSSNVQEALSERWFIRWADWIYDQVGLAEDGGGLVLRREATPRIVQAFRAERDKSGRLMNEGRFLEEVRDLVAKAGYEPPPFDHLRTAWCFSFAISHGFCQWKQGQEATALDMRPAVELIQTTSDGDVGQWRERWHYSGGRFSGREQRMIALRNSDIWLRISDFNLPWAPFDLVDGMGLRNVRRREALEIGIELPDQEPISGWWDIASTSC